MKLKILKSGPTKTRVTSFSVDPDVQLLLDQVKARGGIQRWVLNAALRHYVPIWIDRIGGKNKDGKP